MFTNFLSTNLRRMLAYALLTLPLPSWAAMYCVADAADFYPALQAAATSSADDDIRLVSGALLGLGSRIVTVNGDLRISGGWNTGCVTRLTGSLTTLSASTTADLNLNMNAGALELDRLRFVVWNRVRILDTATPAVAAGNSITIHRCNFSGMTVGLVTVLGKYDLRVSSSIFSGNGGDGLFVTSPTSGASSMNKAILQHNTFSGNSTGLRINTVAGNWASILVESSAMQTSDVFDLALYGQQMTLRNNFWNNEFISTSASLSAGSVDNRSGDSGLDSVLRPIEPTSQLINNAFAGFTLPVSEDYDGGPRSVGSRGDIGAYESSVNDATTLTVTNTNNSGAGSLRQAIIDGNSNPQSKTIEFNIPGSCPHLINLSSALPNVDQPVTIDGYSQPGSAPNQSADGFDGEVCVFLLGGNERLRGLQLRPADSSDTISVHGLGFYGFTSEAILVNGDGRALIGGNLFGTGAMVFNQDFADNVIQVVNAPGTLIGGADRSLRNVIGAGAGAGILMSTSTGRRTVHGNLIGIGLNGTSALPNGVGVRVIGSNDDMILKNTIGFNSAQGVLVTRGGMPDEPAQRVSIISNRIGVNNTNGNAGNGSNGVRLEYGEGHEVSGNRIWHNGTDGLVVLANSRRNLLVRNTYVGNALQAIDLSPNGVNPIDLDAGQTGANDQQNYPIILTAEGSNTQGDVKLVLSTENGSYHVQLMQSPDCSSREGQHVLAATTSAVTIGCGSATSNCSMPIALQVTSAATGLALIGSGITAIAWDEQNNTSEVSACELYEPGPLLLRDGFE